MWIKKVPSTGKIRYCERYTDHLTGKKKDVSVTFDKDTARNRKEATLLLQEMIREKQAPQKETLTLGRLVKEYLDSKRRIVRDSTFCRLDVAMNSLLAIFSADTLIESLTARYVMNTLLSTGLQSKSLNTHIRFFKQLMRWGYNNELVGSLDVINRLALLPVETSKQITLRYLESDKLKKVLDAISDPKYQLFAEFLALSGLRAGEAAALKNDDIDLQTHVIHVEKTYNLNAKTIGPAKTQASIGDVYIQPELECLIKQIRSHFKLMQIRYGYRTNLLFSNEKGNHINNTCFNKCFKKVTLKIVGRALTAHSLRHTHASLLFEQGFTLDEVSRRLRHGDSKITREVYIHVTERLKERDAEKLKSVILLSDK
jgi:integrase